MNHINKPKIQTEKHLFRFRIRTNQDEVIELLFPTDSTRKGKVADQILRGLNKLRHAKELPQITRETSKEFWIMQIK